MSEMVKISIPNKLGYEHIPRITAEKLAHDMGFSDDRIEDLQAVVSEAVIHAVEHSQYSKIDANVETTFIVKITALIIKVVSTEAAELSFQDLSELSRGGAGISSVIVGLADKAEIRTTSEGNIEIEIVFYLEPQSDQYKLKQKGLQRVRGYSDSGRFLEAGMAFFERISRQLRPIWGANVLEIVYGHSSPSKAIETVLEFGRNPEKRLDQYEAHRIVEEVNILQSTTDEPLLKAIMVVARNVGKVIYNAYGYPAPFDHSAGWQIAEDLKRVVDLVDDPEFTAKAWSILWDEEFLVLDAPIECSRGCPVCYSIFEVGGSDNLARVGDNQITVERFFEITGFSQEAIG